MAVHLKPRVTLTEFEAFIALPENHDKTFEFIGGEIAEVPSYPFVSMIAAKFITFFGIYLLQHDIGHVTGEAGGYMVNGERYAPDVAFISNDVFYGPVRACFALLEGWPSLHWVQSAPDLRCRTAPPPSTPGANPSHPAS